MNGGCGFDVKQLSFRAILTGTYRTQTVIQVVRAGTVQFSSVQFSSALPKGNDSPKPCERLTVRPSSLFAGRPVSIEHCLGTMATHTHTLLHHHTTTTSGINMCSTYDDRRIVNHWPQPEDTYPLFPLHHYLIQYPRYRHDTVQPDKYLRIPSTIP